MKTESVLKKVRRKIYEPVWKKVCKTGSIFIAPLQAITLAIFVGFIFFILSQYSNTSEIKLEKVLCDIELFISLFLIAILVIYLSIHLKKSENLYKEIKNETETEQTLWIYNNSISEQIGHKVIQLLILLVIFIVFFFYELLCI